MADINWYLYADVLRTNHAKGFSAAQIAALIPGASRNAVIGKIHRLGLASGAKPKKPPKPKVAKTGGGISFLELTRTTCRWMLGDGTYCGCAVVAYRKPYCSGHTETAKRKT